MTDRLRVFVSSVQKELEDERVIIQSLVQTDPFLSTHCMPVLYECEPASPDRALEGCLGELDRCQVYVLIIGAEYGTQTGSLSITHLEYRRAKEREIPILVFIRGGAHVVRDDGIMRLLEEIDDDGRKYKRFRNVVELREEVRAALVRLLERSFGITPTHDENEIADRAIEAASLFELQMVASVSWESLDHETARHLIGAADLRDPTTISLSDLLASASMRSLVRCDRRSGRHYATAAGVLMLARDPSAVFPQCRVLADAYRSTRRDGEPRDHEDIRLPLPLAVDRAIAFVDRNTRHPMKVIGLNRVRLDEYPVEALREALVNAVVHRDYEDAGRKIKLEVYSDRVVVSSPGGPPFPLTIARLRTGNYYQISRNPVIAQSLSFFHRMEERGLGFGRMRDEMLNHGLDAPSLDLVDGFFVVAFPGPGENIDRIRAPTQGPGTIVTPAVEALLNERQRRMVARLVQGEELTARACAETLGVSRATASGDLGFLVRLGIAARHGEGRSTRYVLAERER